MLNNLRDRGLESDLSYPSKGITLITLQPKKPMVASTFEGTSRIRIAKLEIDQYRIDIDAIDPESFREIIKCSGDAIPGIIEGVMAMSDNNQ
jgi:hypothetical protein